MSDLYTDAFMEYWNPDLMGRLENPTHSETILNKMCGDSVDMEAVIGYNRVLELAFTAQSCCMCQCSASMLVEHLRGKTLDEVMSFSEQDMLKLVRISVPTVRRGCVLLPWNCVRRLCGKAQDKG
jgi:NifU-like protein involved in Fe-S cluster formation